MQLGSHLETNMRATFFVQAELESLRGARQRLIAENLDLRAAAAERDGRIAQLQHQLARAQLAVTAAEEARQQQAAAAAAAPMALPPPADTPAVEGGDAAEGANAAVAQPEADAAAAAVQDAGAEAAEAQDADAEAKPTAPQEGAAAEQPAASAHSSPDQQPERPAAPPQPTPFHLKVRW